MFEQHVPQPVLDEAATRAARRVVIAGFVLAAVYVVLAVWFYGGESPLLAVFGLVIGALFFAGSVVALAGRYSLFALDRARICWLIGGFLGLPLGLVMIVMANLMKMKIERAEEKPEAAAAPAAR